MLCGAHSANLLNPYATIPKEEFLGFLDGLPAVGAGVPAAVFEERHAEELAAAERVGRWPAEG